MVSRSEFWKDHLAGWRSSGLTQRAYCHRHALSLASFGYWRRVLSRRRLAPSSLALVPIVVSEPEPVIETIEVGLPNGLEVQLPVGVTAAGWLGGVGALLRW